MTEWNWTPFGDVNLPTDYKHSVYDATGSLENQAHAKLEHPVLNTAPAPGIRVTEWLGLSDGDLIVDESGREISKLRGDKLVQPD